MRKVGIALLSLIFVVSIFFALKSLSGNVEAREGVKRAKTGAVTPKRDLSAGREGYSNDPLSQLDSMEWKLIVIKNIDVKKGVYKVYDGPVDIYDSSDPSERIKKRVKRGLRDRRATLLTETGGRGDLSEELVNFLIQEHEISKNNWLFLQNVDLRKNLLNTYDKPVDIMTN